MRSAFLEFLQHLPFYGAAVLCIDDEEVRSLVPSVSRALVTFGLAPEADVRGTDLRQEGRSMFFQARLPQEEEPIDVHLNLPGEHNVRNALGAIAIAWELGLDVRGLVDCLAEFAGIGRRFADLGVHDLGGTRARFIEDYGHHPTELAATISAARTGWPDRRVVVVFQPHRFSRTHDLLDEFSRVLSAADALVVTDIYAAGEAPLEGVDSEALCRAIRVRGKVDPVLIHAIDDLGSELPAVLEEGDLVLLLGAGSIEQFADRLRGEQATRETAHG